MNARLPFPYTPLTPEHARQLDELVVSLTPEEALWISGFLAGFARQGNRPAEATPPVGAALTILYGSETGHSAELARRAEALAHARGLSAHAEDMADFRQQAIAKARHLMVITSTHGAGDPPNSAIPFNEFILGRRAPRLDGTKFAVLGLGDSSYEHFCQTARNLDERFAALGAERLHERAECDVDYRSQAEAWIDAVLDAFAPALLAAAPPLTVLARPVAPLAETRGALWQQTNPFPATVLDSLVLNGRGSDKETRHIELSLAGSGLAWEPGDSLGVVAENDPALVDEILSRLALDPAEAVADGDGKIPLRVALSRHYDITALTPGFIKLYGEAAAAGALRALAKPGREADLRQYLADRQIIDVVTEFPLPGVDSRRFVAMLRKLQPRLYSLASSPAAYADEAHLTVAVVRYASRGRTRKGVASSWLAERRGSDDTVPVYVSHNRNFRLPSDTATPIIMIGAGTGVAPFRAFLQEREAKAAPGRNWLFFGDRHFRTDFLYQTEWQRFLKDGRLSRMDVAFSRDQDEKIYVQHRLLQHGKDIYAWLQDGACLYVCGDASHMAPDVHAAIKTIVVREGGISEERAAEMLLEWQSEKRYQRDIY